MDLRRDYVCTHCNVEWLDLNKKRREIRQYIRNIYRIYSSELEHQKKKVPISVCTLIASISVLALIRSKLELAIRYWCNQCASKWSWQQETVALADGNPRTKMVWFIGANGKHSWNICWICLSWWLWVKWIATCRSHDSSVKLYQKHLNTWASYTTWKHFKCSEFKHSWIRNSLEFIPPRRY